VDVDQLDAERGAGELEAGQVGAPVEAAKVPPDPLDPDRRRPGRRVSDLPDLVQPLELPPIVDEDQSFVVAPGVRHDHPVPPPHPPHDVVQVGKVLPALLHRHDVEPAKNLRQQREIALPADLGPQVGDVPGSQQEPPKPLPWHPVELPVFPEPPALDPHVEGIPELGHGKDRHTVLTPAETAAE
jgi:hypothetical protein